ncbi:SAM-dependent methyltransferase [Burkholderia sp. ABCPW 14]|uniref:class I SAM-dependent methyltransferase n=1 Tax=Burkholderia sp. ABCPW 14 TaxID=1637860 RepID=UPI000770C12B|nr:class I SAM-dependent methyltransferase [Burkholderia sp. ABCPW 14]KVD84381.1 SAM-dependent methyltransferase [Burkholderia sp. ABCPW 14]
MKKPTMQATGCRIRNDRVAIDYRDTYRFFKSRAASGRDKVVQVLYQDDNPALAHARAQAELDMLLSSIEFDGRAVLDIGCGNGRLADGVIDRVAYYFGVDLVAEFVDDAKRSLKVRGVPDDRYGFRAAPCSGRVIAELARARRFDVFLMSGVSIYLNDGDFADCLTSIARAMEPGGVLYLRDPIEMFDTRLTLRNFASSTLAADYSVIYRGAVDYLGMIGSNFDGTFDVGPLTPMYRDADLNGRLSTKQHYIVIRKS